MKNLLFQRISEFILFTNNKIANDLSNKTLTYDKRLIKKLTVNTFIIKKKMVLLKPNIKFMIF